MKQKTRFKKFGNIGIGQYIGPWMADISVSASKKPYRSISSQQCEKTRFETVLPRHGWCTVSPFGSNLLQCTKAILSLLFLVEILLWLWTVLFGLN